MKFKAWFYLPFERAGTKIAKLVLKKNHAGRQKLERELGFLFTKEEVRTVEKHIAEKAAKILFVLFWGAGLCIAAELAAGMEQKERTVIERPDYGQGEIQTELVVRMEGETEERTVTVNIQERKYTDAEIEALFQKTEAELETALKGENDALSEVRTDLCFPVSFAEGAVTAEWFCDPFEMLDETGRIIGKPAEEGTQAEIRVNLRCQEQVKELIFSATLFPPVRTEKEAQAERIAGAAEQAEQEGVFEKELVLPEEVDGKKLYWETKTESVTGILLFVVSVTAAALAQNEDEKIYRLAEEKRMRLRMDYPAFLYKLTALLRAGMTIRAAFWKIAENYRQQEKMSASNRQNEQKRFAYEEVTRCCNEMQAGVAEARAYENFGKRCQLPEYVKIGTILAQNLKKGSDGLADLLEREAVQGMEERRNLARKLGEKAGTKLLFPMMLMLAAVLAILMAPAILSFSF